MLDMTMSADWEMGVALDLFQYHRNDESWLTPQQKQAKPAKLPKLILPAILALTEGQDDSRSEDDHAAMVELYAERQSEGLPLYEAAPVNTGADEVLEFASTDAIQAAVTKYLDFRYTKSST